MTGGSVSICPSKGGSSEGDGWLTVERALIGDIVDQQDTHRSAVVGGRDSAETLLSSRVPLTK